MLFGLPSNPKHCKVKLFGKTHVAVPLERTYQGRRKLLRRKNEACLTTLVMSVITIALQRTPDGTGSLLGRGHSDEDQSNLALFLAVTLDVKVRELGLWIQVIKADLFSGDLRIEPQDLNNIPECFQGMALTAKILGNPIQALSRFS